MRKLFLLQGAPGSGKSTLIEDLGVGDNTLGYDQFRHLYGVRAHALDGPVCAIPSQAEADAIKACKSAAEHRMRLGDTLFIDNTNVNPRDIRGWKAMADRHGYETFIVDVQGDTTDAHLLGRDATRDPFKKIANDQVILSMANKHRNHQRIDGIRYIKPEDIEANLMYYVFDADAYKQVVIVGDVQGCGEALERLFWEVNAEGSDPFSDPNTLWVFVGDLFDRGPTPGKVAQALLGSTGKLPGNVVLVEGNHERSIRETITGVREYKESRITLDILKKEGFSEKVILDLVNSATPFFPFSIGSWEYWVTHAGILPEVMRDTWVHVGPLTYAAYRAGLIPDFAFVMGTGHRDNTYHGQSSYKSVLKALDDAVRDAPWLQFFGHRNDSDKSPLDYDLIRPLESKVEFGGKLSAIVLEVKDWSETLIQVDGEGEPR